MPSGDSSGGASSSTPTAAAAATSGQDTTPSAGATQPGAPNANSAASQALAAVSNQPSFTQDQVQVLLQSALAAFFSRQNTAAQPAPAAPAAAPVTAAAFPAFTFAPSAAPPAGASLLDLFPSIDGTVLLDIARHEFKPGDLYKLDTRHKDRAARQILELNSGVVAVRNQAPRGYPSFHSLDVPLSTFFNVLAGFASTGSNATALYHLTASTMTYLARLVQFSLDYQWSAVVAYHFDFHYKRRRDMLRGDYSGWATIDTGLQAKHLIGKERWRISTTAKASGTTKTAHSADANVCRNFNKGACASPCAHNRVHKCTSCGAADHGQSVCTKSAT